CPLCDPRPVRPPAPQEPEGFSYLLPRDVVAEQHVLVAQVKPAAEHRRMRPAVQLGPIRLVEVSFLLIAVGSSLHESDRTFLAAAIKHAVSAGDRPLADAAVRPGDFPSLRLHADELAFIETVDVLAQRDDVAVMALQLLARVERRRLERAAGEVDLADRVAD